MPKNLLLHFSITNLVELCEEKSRQSYFEIYLEDNNEIKVAGIDASLYESKGLSEISIQDFPIRDKAVHLKIKRHRWHLKTDLGKIIHNDFTYISEGSGFTQELSDFLKSTGRYKG